jgi:hypothetical protein
MLRANCLFRLLCLPKMISPRCPIMPIREALFAADGIEVGLLHVVDDQIVDALIVQLGSLRCA